MKWQNKGHEFDDVYNNIEKKDRFYLFGAGEYGGILYGLLEKEISILGFIDNAPEKQGTLFNGKPVLSLEQAAGQAGPSTGIIVAVSPYTRLPIMQQLMIKGFVQGENVFTMEMFMSVYEAYAKGRVYMPSISFLPSTRCNLRCEACLNFTTYMKHFDERPWEQIREDVDLFFSCVDFIMLFHISGGEPMLYPHMGRLVEYIDANYREKIQILRTVTNGTVLPKPELLALLAKHNTELTVDDYREAVPESGETFDELLKELEKHHVKYEVNKADEWIDLAPAATNHEDWSEFRLQKQFESCHVPWQELRGGRIYSCNYASYAMVAGLAGTDETEYFDLKKYTPGRCKELMEFRMGYNEKGYVEFCKRCSGYIDINPNKVMPAKQAGRQYGQ